MPERLLAWLWRFGRPTEAAISASARDLDALDVRLTDLEAEQRDIAARLRLLEMQAAPRGER